jgi:hypothetical protein
MNENEKALLALAINDVRCPVCGEFRLVPYPFEDAREYLRFPIFCEHCASLLTEEEVLSDGEIGTGPETESSSCG